ncbi:hypothetical protein Bresa_01183|uniref:Uncharacterized protein n=1 Tax=Brenneria salicis ATCC 15712 = DSM 30166 TaxID=714314 RepID=A0A366IBT9_9GAMM|nr:hypothetical protein [Brenneria salicis ATCC 15712 = DSM 30166]RBP66554.1 hypothetical protein DES54_10383 [Brenneria salicis ATCC 15712 = DSM 30166]
MPENMDALLSISTPLFNAVLLLPVWVTDRESLP